jgi:hypothetical protein
MSNAGKSLFVFGIYESILGLTLIFVPNLLLTLFGMPATSEPWIRVGGMLVLFLGVYYAQFGRKELTDLMRWTVYLRSSVIVFFIVFVLLGIAPAPLILFAGADLLGAIWTLWALRAPTAIAGGEPRTA